MPRKEQKTQRRRSSKETRTDRVRKKVVGAVAGVVLLCDLNNF